MEWGTWTWSAMARRPPQQERCGAWGGESKAGQVAASGKVLPFELQRLMRHKSITTSMIYVNMAGQKLPPIDVF